MGIVVISEALTFFSELDNFKIINASRITRIAKGSGRPVREVNELFEQYKQFEKVFKNKNLKNLNPRSIFNIISFYFSLLRERTGTL